MTVCRSSRSQNVSIRHRRSLSSIRPRRSIFDGANRPSLFEDDERLMEMRRARGHAFAFNKRESQSAVAFVPASGIARN